MMQRADVMEIIRVKGDSPPEVFEKMSAIDIACIGSEGWSAEAFFGEELPSPLILDVRHDGDRMIPFGKIDPVLLKKLYNDAGVKAYERNLIPVVKDSGGNILWVPCVKRSAFFLHAGKKGIRIRAKKL